MARQITSRTKRTTASPVYRTRRVVVGMFGLVLLGVAAMGTSLIIKPPGTLPRHGATAQMPYVRRLCPPSAGTSTGAEPRYATSPPTSPCNRHRPYWLSGPAHSRTGHRDDEWCGDGGARVSSTKPVPLSCKSTSVTSTRRHSVYMGADLARTRHPVGNKPRGAHWLKQVGSPVMAKRRPKTGVGLYVLAGPLPGGLFRYQLRQIRR